MLVRPANLIGLSTSRGLETFPVYETHDYGPRPSLLPKNAPNVEPGDSSGSIALEIEECETNVLSDCALLSSMPELHAFSCETGMHKKKAVSGKGAALGVYRRQNCVHSNSIDAET